jgi:hypothetical protein
MILICDMLNPSTTSLEDPMPACTTEEHTLPQVEALLAGTLALMTGYSQALLAAQQPEHRVLMGRKIGNNLQLLAEHPLLSTPFQTMLTSLKHRWSQMAACTAEAALDIEALNVAPARGAMPQESCCQAGPRGLAGGLDTTRLCEPPRRLQ